MQNPHCLLCLVPFGQWVGPFFHSYFFIIWVGPDQNRKLSRWANEYIPVPAYSHRFHYKTPEKHSLIDKYNTFQKKWLWDLTELWRVWGRFIFAQSMMEIWVFYCLYFRFCQGWYCSHDRIVNKSRSTYQLFFDLMNMHALQFLSECNSAVLQSFWSLHLLIKTLKGTLCPICPLSKELRNIYLQ